MLASLEDYHVAKSNFDTLQVAVGDKMTVNEQEFDEIFSLICQDPSEHFQLFDVWGLGKVDVMEVFAVVLVYCKSRIELKIPLLFKLYVVIFVICSYSNVPRLDLILTIRNSLHRMNWFS